MTDDVKLVYEFPLQFSIIDNESSGQTHISSQDCIPKGDWHQFPLQDVRRSDDKHLCVDGDDMFIRVTTPIKFVQRGRLQSLRNMQLSYFI